MVAPTCPTCGRTASPGTRHCPEDGSLLRTWLSNSWDAPAPPGAELPLPSPSTTAEVDPLIGAVVGDYVVKRRLGQGGIGLVYAGEHPLIGRRVAIKVLRPQYARDPQQIERLLAEARASSLIRHRGVVDIFNFGQLADGRHYMVMEHLEGRGLDAELLARGPLPLAEVLAILDEVLSALGAGHKVGIIHRDLKPSNVFLVQQPDLTRYVKLLDFGLATSGVAPAAQASDRPADVFVGTPEYIAPEQARAEEVGPATDLYGVGVLCFELLTGRLPFHADTSSGWVLQHLDALPPAPSTLRPQVPAKLDRLVLRLLAKKPEGRPSSTDEVRRELAELRVPVDAAFGNQAVRRRPARAPLWVTAGLLTAAAVGAAWWMSFRPPETAPPRVTVTPHLAPVEPAATPSGP
jgi:eukaryotic-like serine/threonine-protein kinase